MTERFIVDDCGTLIDMHTRDTFDYVSDVCNLLNELHEENIQLSDKNRELTAKLTQAHCDIVHLMRGEEI